MLLLCALVAGSGSVWADPTVLFHETFGDNENKARAWDDSYSVKSGIALVYEEAYYSMTNVKQGKNTTGSTKSGLNQSTKDVDAVFIVGPLNVAGYNGLTLKYQWKAASIGETYFTSASYATSASGEYTTIKTIGNTPGATSGGATSFVECSYDIPAAACVSSLYLKIVFNTSNTQAIIDEVDLSCEGAALPVSQDCIPVATMSIATCTYSSKTWTNNDNNDYTFGDGATDIPTKDYDGDELIKLPYGKTYSVTVPSGITVTKVAITGKSASADGTPITVDGLTQTIKNSITTAYYPISSPSAGASVSISTATKVFGLQSIVLYTADGKTLTTSANMAGWRAFYDGSQAYTADENTSVYVADSDPVGTTITLKNIGKGVPTGVPVILKTSAGDHKIVLTKGGSATYTGTNKLSVTTGSDVTSKYRLGYNSTNGVGFYPYSATSPAAGIVYLNVDASAHALNIDFEEGDVTGIAEVSAKKEFNGEYFNLAGQRVDANHKGIVIVNGKKFFNK